MTKQKSSPEAEGRFTAPMTRAPIIPRNPYTPYEQKVIPDFGVSLTKQAFTDECDINKILARYKTTGQITHFASRLGEFADVENIDFQTAMNRVKNAEDLFESLPAKIRAEFDQNPGKFLEFALNPASAPELAAMGLITPDDISVLYPDYRPSTASTEALDAIASPTQPVSGSS